MGKAAKTSTASAAAVVEQAITPAAGPADAEQVSTEAQAAEGDEAAIDQITDDPAASTTNAIVAEPVDTQPAALDEAAASAVDLGGATVEPGIELPAGPEAAVAIDPAPAALPRTVRARVLAFCNLGAPDDVIEIEADLVKTLGDVIDTDPAAVAYAESLKA